MSGLTTTRTARFIATMFAVLGMFFLLVERALSSVLVLAQTGVDKGLARYNNFTGRFAAKNFADDRELLALLRDAKDMLPMADTLLTLLFIAGILVLVIAVFGLAFPKQFVQILVALHLLKREEPNGESA